MTVMLQIPIYVDDSKYREAMEGLYEVAKDAGFKMQPKYEAFRNTQRTGMMIAIGELFTAVLEGKVKISTPR